MGVHRHSSRPEPPHLGPHRFYGTTTDSTRDGFLYRPPEGEPWRVYAVAFVNGKMLRADLHRRLQSTHRAFVAGDGRQRFAAFTDIVSRGSTARTLYEQLAVAVSREDL